MYFLVNKDKKILNKIKLRARNCYFCQKELDYYEYINKNFHMSLNYLNILWNCPWIRLLCCKCFKQENLHNNKYKIKDKRFKKKEI